MAQFSSLPLFPSDDDANTPFNGSNNDALQRFHMAPTSQLGSAEPIHVIHNISTTQSLVMALRSTTQQPHTIKARPVIIPGVRKTSVQQPEGASLRMHPKLRHGIVLGAIFLVLCMTLVSLAPLSAGQNPAQIFTGAINWVQAKQFSWNISSHVPIVTQNKNVPAAPALAAAPPMMNLPKSQYVAIAQQDAATVGIPPDYFVRQINQESGFNPNAYSPAGAVGIAQFLPSTAANLGVNPYDPVQALRGAANLMASYAHQYGGDYAKALAAYNAGGGTVNYAVNSCGGNWINCLPAETRNYIYVIMGI